MMETSMHYLARDTLFTTEKPYSTDFKVDHIAGASATNHTMDERKLTIHPVLKPHKFNLETHGFCVVTSELRVRPELLIRERERYQSIYWEQTKELIKTRFPEYSFVECFDLTIRRRAPEFPASELGEALFEQPATRPHADVTARYVQAAAERGFPKHNNFFESKDIDFINVWRVLTGPNDDWPLALCDYTTIDKDKDIQDSDGIRLDRVDELSLLHHNEDHMWYFVPQQRPEDVIIFRNADSLGERARAFHCAVHNRYSTTQPRFSAEVRCIAVR